MGRVARGGKLGSRDETTMVAVGVAKKVALPSILVGTDWGCQERDSGAEAAHRGVASFF